MDIKSIILFVAGLLVLLFISCKEEKQVPSVTTGELSEITTQSVIVSGSITDDGGADVFQKGIIWSSFENPDIGLNDGKSTEGEGNDSFLTEITGLLPSTNYYVRAYAKNSEGVGYGEVISFNTLEAGTEIIKPSVITLEAEIVESNSAKVGGEITSDGGDQIVVRGIVWSTYENPSLDENLGYSEAGDEVGTFESEITELLPATQYYYKAYATNSAGTAYGAQMSFTTLEEASERTPCPGMPEVTDIDGNTYPTVIIEDQCWLAENLRTTKYNDNTEIENLTLSDDWMNATEGAYVWFDNDIDNKETYGALYNFFAVTSGKLCPDGWRVATDNDWKILEGNHDSELHPESSEWDNESWRGTDAGYNLKSTDGWIGMGNGDDIYGFTALPGGQRNAMDGEFERAGEWGTWWSDKNEEENETYRRYINHENQNIARFNSNPRSGYSVRCIKN